MLYILGTPLLHACVCCKGVNIVLPDLVYLSTTMVSDHRGSNSQVIDFERVEICPIFMVRIENSEKSNT